MNYSDSDPIPLVEWQTCFTVRKGSWMMWFMVLQVISTLMELVQLGRTSEHEKDLEILLLCRQLAIYQRQQTHVPLLARSEKVTLVVLAARLRTRSGRMYQSVPHTGLRGRGWYAARGHSRGRDSRTASRAFPQAA